MLVKWAWSCSSRLGPWDLEGNHVQSGRETDLTQQFSSPQSCPTHAGCTKEDPQLETDSVMTLPLCLLNLFSLLVFLNMMLIGGVWS